MEEATGRRGGVTPEPPSPLQAERKGDPVVSDAIRRKRGRPRKKVQEEKGNTAESKERRPRQPVVSGTPRGVPAPPRPMRQAIVSSPLVDCGEVSHSHEVFSVPRKCVVSRSDDWMKLPDIGFLLSIIVIFAV